MYDLSQDTAAPSQNTIIQESPTQDDPTENMTNLADEQQETSNSYIKAEVTIVPEEDSGTIPLHEENISDSQENLEATIEEVDGTTCNTDSSSTVSDPEPKLDPEPEVEPKPDPELEPKPEPDFQERAL